MGVKRVHGDIEGERLNAQQQVLEVVRRIPRGRVMTYGQISEVMASRLPDFPKGLQRSMLEEEGVEFRANGTLDLEIYRWWPAGRSRG